MENITRKHPKSGFSGKVSIIIGLSNILLLALGYADIKYSTGWSEVIFSVLGISLLIGIGTGIAALISRRAWVGLVINILLSIFIGLSMLSLILYATYKVSKSLGLAP